jgi:hypothetical protein
VKSRPVQSKAHPSSERVLGKITATRFGRGGYQDCQFGLEVALSSKSGDCLDFVSGGWDYEQISPTETSEWTEDDRATSMSSMCRSVSRILESARVSDVSGLKGKPVEIVFENNQLKSWRILTEVL